MNKAARLIGAVGAVSVLAAGVFWASCRPRAPVESYTEAQRPARIRPDYADCVIPPNIAPLNFVIEEPGAGYFVRVRPARGASLEIDGSGPDIIIPPKPWNRMLRENKGQEFRFEIYVRDAAGRWMRYKDLTNTVAEHDVDRYLCYRTLDPVYRWWGILTINQRDLTSFEESTPINNRGFNGECLNCHTFWNRRGDHMLLQIRSKLYGTSMIIARQNTVTKIDARTEFNASPASYSCWHPNGRLLAFASIKVMQFYHTIGDTRDVFDTASDVCLYDVDANRVSTHPALARPDRLETYPHWSPDGRYLYFCDAPQLPYERFREVRYDLCRLRYDPETNRFDDQPETLISAEQIKKSVTHPQVSPDGRWLLFCLCDYGNFSIYQRSSDLYLMDLNTKEYRPLPINSEASESFHFWSGNSRWIVFSSKRMDGMLARPFFCYMDPNGQASKPFILPQKNPRFYDTYLKTYNIPTFIQEPVSITQGQATRLITDKTRFLKAKLDPQVKAYMETIIPPASAPERQNSTQESYSFE